MKPEKNDLRGIVRRAYKQVGRAVARYNMLQEGDRILVGFSGGVDSLAMLKLLSLRKQRIVIDFELIACFIDTDFIKINKEKLICYLESTGIQYIVKKLELAGKNINCFHCSGNRRRILFETARELECNKIALGHHLDDIVETTLMNLFYRGEISTSPPAIELFGGKVRLIRPLCYLLKREITDFVLELDLPILDYDCPYGKDNKREVIRKIIGEMEKECFYVKKNVFGALGRVKQDYLV